MNRLSLAKFSPSCGYLFASAVVLLMVAIKYFLPTIIGNESVYLIGARQILEPSFLAHDWTLSEERLNILFSALIAPLWAIFEDHLDVALFGRLAGWVLLLYALSMLAREIGIRWYAYAFGLIIWIYSGQSLAAGEWLFGGIEQKVPAYACLILSLTYLLRNEIKVSGLLIGLAVGFHVLVGGWGGIALGGTLLVMRVRSRPYDIVRFAIAAAIVGLPFVLLALRYLAADATPETIVTSKIDIDKYLVQFRGPHHLDPSYFLQEKGLIVISVITAITLFSTWRVVTREKAKILLALLGFLGLFFTAGLIARELELFWFLKFYPFRVFDSLVLLFFWLTAPELLARSITFFSDRNHWNLNSAKTIFTMTALVGAVVVWKAGRAVIAITYETPQFAAAWHDYRTHDEPPLRDMSHWIKSHTKDSTTFIAPPCHAQFWLEAERPMLVAFKHVPTNKQRFAEWYQRLVMLNGNKELTVRGTKNCSERVLQKSFERLSVELLVQLQTKFGADYFLTTARRKDIDKALVYNNQGYYLYNIKSLDKPILSGQILKNF